MFRPIHRPSSSYQDHDFPINALFELSDGKQCTVQEYFQKKYKLQLTNPDANLLVCKDRGNNNFLIAITKSQRITIPQNWKPVSKNNQGVRCSSECSSKIDRYRKERQKNPIGCRQV